MDIYPRGQRTLFVCYCKEQQQTNRYGMARLKKNFSKHVELERVIDRDTRLAKRTSGHAPAKHDGLEIRGRVGVHRCRT